MAESDIQILSEHADPARRAATLVSCGVKDHPDTDNITPPVDAILELSALARVRQENIWGDERAGTRMCETLCANSETENHIPGSFRSAFCSLDKTDESDTQEDETEAERIAISRKRSDPLLHPKSFPNKNICEEVVALCCSRIIAGDE